ncbi:DUF1842 domain-containing protein [Chromobacterium sinusclupearum]|uniref:DUF1842 domain-containing protein n=1 Tax=Chromobacterium sinusclupearum TaxID=2077146 RepID=A0A2K4MIX7_9NEIS|nr:MULTISPECIES: DUF1842 domain-containing protein [Chromobacterium]OHX18350.1 hypothetical protein BI343_09030 [Chromobacterium amazonense]POA97018.1 DUF1842 domain-containing protein [Chromobacterium sinusclupearum]
MSEELFLVRLATATSAYGAPILNLNLVVDTANKKVAGTASVFQSTNPPVDFKANVWGYFSVLGDQVILVLDGSPTSPISKVAETFHLRGHLSADWQNGTVSYKYFYNGEWHNVVNQHLAATSTVAEDISNTSANAGSHFHTLYASALTEASRADVGETKARQLLAAAEAQIRSLNEALEKLGSR